jgi:hypothetical protein
MSSCSRWGLVFGECFSLLLKPKPLRFEPQFKLAHLFWHCVQYSAEDFDIGHILWLDLDDIVHPMPKEGVVTNSLAAFQ